MITDSRHFEDDPDAGPGADPDADHIKVKIRIGIRSRISIKVMRIRNPDLPIASQVFYAAKI